MKFTEVAESNFNRYLRDNPYPGRGLVIGRSGNNRWLLIYWIMGRSTNSRNRRFVAENGILRTVPIDYEKVKDPSLIIYEAMLELPDIFLVSNGDQTKTMFEGLKKQVPIQVSLASREREPDAPNFTPRICGMLDIKKIPVATLAILKANAMDPAYTDRYYFEPAVDRGGYGYGLTTYTGDGDPLPSFSGDPLLLPCTGNADEVFESYWAALNPENRVALAIKEVTADGKDSRIILRNQY